MRTAVPAQSPSHPVVNRRRGWRFVDGTANEWNVSRRAAAAILLAPWLVALGGVLAALAGKDVYKWLTREDGFAENAQVLFFGLAMLLALRIGRRLGSAGRPRIAGLYLLAAAGLVFLIGEELNWGQRILGLETPAPLAEINRQREISVHNIYGIEPIFRQAKLLLGICGVLFPLAVHRWQVLRRHREALSLLVPPLSLVPYFFVLFVWQAGKFFVGPPIQHAFAFLEYSEVIELVLATAIFLFMLFQWRQLRRTEPPAV